ncbi:DNA helicase protein [Dioscorea alata]|uniref:DNA helicase protein n=1 Tax=Dioscorea alata TaxID=55571 RepID=A0ACB7V813_DIOAL|nr:DNA helicase protein [Dioscorea alata]
MDYSMNVSSMLSRRDPIQQEKEEQQEHVQQLRGPNGEDTLLASSVHGVQGGNNLSPSSAAIPCSQSSDKLSALYQENQNEGEGVHQHGEFQQQAYYQLAPQTAIPQKLYGNLCAQQSGQNSNGGLSESDPNLLQSAFRIQMQQGITSADRPNELKPSQIPIQQSHSSGMMMIGQQVPVDLQNIANAQLRLQLQTKTNARLAATNRSTVTSVGGRCSYQPSWQQQARPPLSLPSSRLGTSFDALVAQMGHLSPQLAIPPGFQSSGGATTMLNSNNFRMQQQQNGVRHSDNHNEMVPKHPIEAVNQGKSIDLSQSSQWTSCNAMNLSSPKNMPTPPVTRRMANLMPMKQNLHMSQGASSSSGGSGIQAPSRGESIQLPQPRLGFGFTKMQYVTFKTQVLAFKRLRRGDKALPFEMLISITPPPLHLPHQHTFLEHIIKRTDGRQERVADFSKSKVHASVKVENFQGKENVTSSGHMPAVEEGSQMFNVQGYCNPYQANVSPAESTRFPTLSPTVGHGQLAFAGNILVPNNISRRKCPAPHLGHSSFMRNSRHGSSGETKSDPSKKLSLAYDTNHLLTAEGIAILNKKITESLNKIGSLLSLNLERKRIKPDVVLRLQIEEKKLRLSNFQARLRDEVTQRQEEILAMPDNIYQKFSRQCQRQRTNLLRQSQQVHEKLRKGKLKSINLGRKKFLEAHSAIRDARSFCNRGVMKFHERMLKSFPKKKDEDRTKRMEALKNNDVDRYREMLLEQQVGISGAAAERFSILSSFLSQTEEYILKLGQKLIATKEQQEQEPTASGTEVAVRSQGLSEDDVKNAVACAREDVMVRNNFCAPNAQKDSSSVSKYYNLAHAMNEIVTQPSLLQGGTLRDYQIVGLKWMLSLYNNELNGILADEMGLGKTVQVMALIAYLMEFKGNHGPHLIIVPNAVLVNWKSELFKWLPSVSCIFYVGTKEQRLKIFTEAVCAVKFNVLVTSYEFVMHDRSKLSKVDWKYIIIDEAQRMKDRESVLARNLDRYRCQRRLLLTGTPLQNDLKELWSLLNLLLPEVFDNHKTFHDWFSKPLCKVASSHNSEDEWLETEKKVIIIHRLHQILEPFVLRRRVEDVEGALPPKVSVVVRCRMSAVQSCIYDWIRDSGTIRLYPEHEMRKVQRNPKYNVKKYTNLTNKCIELRKVCNHPLLNYPYFNDYSKDFIVRSCGKLWVLDRILMKLKRAGHRVLLFSTMTSLLDIVEEYLQWRKLIYARIDGKSSLQNRETAITYFNSPDSDCFIFLLSIRAAGKGLNLQTADTVVIYDPDPNPQNEVQAMARVHRIGQMRPVKVIYMETVAAEKISSSEKDDDMKNGGTGDLEDGLAPKERYKASIESLIRSKIQQYKIKMADEVINAGRFDQITTHEERRLTLETLLHHEERNQETVHDVPTLKEVNRMIARSEEEIKLFDQMDEEFDQSEEMIMKIHQVPEWLRASSEELNSIISSSSKKPSKSILTGNIDDKSGKKRGRPKGSKNQKKSSIVRELDYKFDEDSGASSEVGEYSSGEEEVEIEDSEDEKLSDKDQFDEVDPVFGGVQIKLSQPIGQQPNKKRICSIPKSEVAQHFSEVPLKLKHDHDMMLKTHPKIEPSNEPILVQCYKRDSSSLNKKCFFSSRNLSLTALPEHEPLGFLSGLADGSSQDADSRRKDCVGENMSYSTQRKCMYVVSTLRRRIEQDGNQIIPALSVFWKMASQAGATTTLDLQKIKQKVERSEYDNVVNFIEDVQLAFKVAVKFYNYSNQARYEAMKLNTIFFDIMKTLFPETDIEASKYSIIFFQPVGGLIKGRTSAHKHDSEFHTGSNSSANVTAGQSSPLALLLGDVVIGKKKRKQRERSSVMTWFPLQQQEEHNGGHGTSMVSEVQQAAKRMRIDGGKIKAN